MQGPTREQVFQALFSVFFRSVTGCASYTRRTELPGKMNAEDLRPGNLKFYLVELPFEKTDREGGIPIKKRTWEAGALVYFQNTDPEIAGMTIANPIIDAIESLIEPPIGQPANMLGGIINGGCWIDGETLKESGDTDSKGVGFVWVPFKILVP